MTRKERNISMTTLEKRLREMYFADDLGAINQPSVGIPDQMLDLMRAAARIGAELERAACASITDESAGSWAYEAEHAGNPSVVAEARMAQGEALALGRAIRTRGHDDQG